MKLAVISDSHGDLASFDKVLRMIREEGFQHLAHAGDFVTDGVDVLIAEYPDIQFYMAVGNCDVFSDIPIELNRLPNVRVDREVIFELEGKRFFVSHIERDVQRNLLQSPVDVFIHGHTHQPKIENKTDFIVLNPGSLRDGAGFTQITLPELKIDRRFRLS